MFEGYWCHEFSWIHRTRTILSLSSSCCTHFFGKHYIFSRWTRKMYFLIFFFSKKKAIISLSNYLKTTTHTKKKKTFSWHFFFSSKAFINEDGEEDPLVVSEAGDDVPRNKFLIYSSKLLSCQLTMLHNALILRSMKTNAKKSSCYYIPLTRLQAQENRDTLVKTLYQLIFQWIVNRINQEMDSENVNFFFFLSYLFIFFFFI